MATQGLLTIMKDGKVYRKIITGSNGFNLEGILKDYSHGDLVEMSPEELYNLALRCNFGSEIDLVVSYFDKHNKVCHFHNTELDHEFTPWYWDCFFLPEFNPRWGCGIADRVVVSTVE